MALEDVADGLQALSLSDPECLLFCPTGDNEWLRKTFDDVPRYLFRVFTAKSYGTNDSSWMKSKDAGDAAANSRVDIFARNKQEVASMLNSHLRWWQGPSNLVSWTSSLLFALRYIFYRHCNPKDGSSFDDIFLCIIDTTRFSKGVFLRDMDLIQNYRTFDHCLDNFGELRVKKHNEFKGWFYFGEYISQGALKIEGNCDIVSAQAIIDRRLFDIQPEFRTFKQWKREEKHRPPLANEVIRLRETFYQETVEQQPISQKELLAAVDIAQLFEPRWRLPIVANLIALLPRRSEDSTILQAFRAAPFTDDDRMNCSPSKTKVIADDTLPEVQQFNSIIRSVHKDFCVRRLSAMPLNSESDRV